MTQEITLMLGDCIERMREMEDGTVGSIVCDPPYGLEFMSFEWDKLFPNKGKWKGKRHKPTLERRTDTPHHRANVKQPRFLRKCETCGGNSSGQWGRCKCENPMFRVPEKILSLQRDWHLAWLEEAYRVLAPSGTIKAFSATRTFHRLAAAMELAGFTGIRIEAWVYGSGFPKSLNIGKAIDRSGGVKTLQSRQPEGITFAQTLQSHRKAAGVSKTEMASWFPYAEVTKNWERLDNGFRVPSESDFQVLKDRLGLPDSLCESLWAEDQRRLVSDGGTDRRSDGTVIGLAHTGKVWAPVTEDAQLWDDWGTALKPAWEPFVVADKADPR